MILMIMAGALTAAQAPGADNSFGRAVQAVEARLTEIDKIESTIPGRAIVAVQVGHKPLINVHGTTRITDGEPVSPATPFYIASMTKAFVGLMAMRLDGAGIMPLDLTLAEVFPDMTVTGVNLRQVTMRRLLSHQVGFTAQALNFRTAYTDPVRVSDYSRIVALTQAPADAKFQYSNLGYLLYTAALERRTGRSWKAWLEEMVLNPLGMRQSSARSSDLTGVAWGHQRVGDSWKVFAPKRDMVMHGAGGLVVSAGDMARFLTAEAGGRSSIPSAAIRRAHSGKVVLELKDGPMQCSGYSFGWIKCEAFGESILTHTGEYAGQRSVMLLAPAHRAGFAAMFNSESMTGGLGQQLAMVFLANLAGKAGEMPDATAFAAEYGKMAARYRTNLAQREVQALAQPQWGGWAWNPDLGALTEYAGVYRHPAYGDLDVSVGGGGLEVRLNGTALTVRPAVKDRFAAGLASYDDRMPLVFERDPSGRIIAANLNDIRLERALR